MAVTKDWLPASREGVLAMAGDWIAVCTVEQADWNIPGAAMTELSTLREAASAALARLRKGGEVLRRANESLKERRSPSHEGNLVNGRRLMGESRGRCAAGEAGGLFGAGAYRERAARRKTAPSSQKVIYLFLCLLQYARTPIALSHSSNLFKLPPFFLFP
jgi:hypothetical protein